MRLYTKNDILILNMVMNKINVNTIYKFNIQTKAKLYATMVQNSFYFFLVFEKMHLRYLEKNG